MVPSDFGNKVAEIGSESGLVMPSQLEHNLYSQMKLESAPCGYWHNVGHGDVDETGSIFCRVSDDLPLDGCRTWTVSVEHRWERIRLPKDGNELGLLSWNVYSQIGLRACRESLIRSWARKGFIILLRYKKH